MAGTPQNPANVPQNPDITQQIPELDETQAKLKSEQDDPDDFMTDPKLTELKNTAATEIEKDLVQTGLLTPEKWKEIKKKLDDLQATANLDDDPKTKEVKETEVETAVKAVVDAITSAELWLFVRKEGEEQKTGFRAILGHKTFKEKEEFLLGKDGAPLAEEIIRALLIPEKGQQKIRETVKILVEKGFLQGKYSVQKNEKGEVGVRATKDGKFDPLEEKTAAAPPSPPESGDTPQSEMARLLFRNFLTEKSAQNEKTMKEVDEWLGKNSGAAGVINQIKAAQPTAEAIRYISGKFEAQVKKDGNNIWEAIDLPMSSAEKYLASVESFNGKINQWKHGHRFMAVLEGFLTKVFGRDLIADQTFLGDVIRGLIGIQLNEDDFPKKTEDVQHTLDTYIARAKQGEKGSAFGGHLDGAAESDDLVKNMMDDLKLFNTSASPIRIIESKSNAIKGSHETAGRVVLDCPTASQAAAIEIYAQKHSEGFMEQLRGYVDKYAEKIEDKMGDGKIKQTLSGLLADANESNEENYSDRKKNYPDNVMARYKGTGGGGYQVEIVWFSDGHGKAIPQNNEKAKTQPADKPASPK